MIIFRIKFFLIIVFLQPIATDKTQIIILYSIDLMIEVIAKEDIIWNFLLAFN